jgi:hypothetical protein
VCAVHVHVITTSSAGIVKLSALSQLNEYHGAVALGAIVTAAQYLYFCVVGNDE